MSSKNIATNEENVIPTLAIAAGNCQVVFVWWDLVMDVKGDVLLSCAPVWCHPLGMMLPICNLNSVCS